MAVPRQTWHLSDAGILRKKEEDEELLVFGYSCKIFRDDEKAQFIDQGKHLIPWMGDETLKIDRYDGRAALADLRECEAPTGGYDLWASLSDAERRVEQLCDEERYRALTHNEEEEALYQEEELKRLQQALSAENTYGQVAYQYDESGQPVGDHKPEGSGDTTVPAAEEDEPFVAPQELDIPLNMVLPETVKANAIIEKTAMFISEQGAQMEILLKMKQAKNPQFQFLSFDDPLHTYYRHLLMAIKTGRYRPKPPKEEEPDEGDPDDEDDGYYLHPSLASSASRIELAPSIPSINYKPSADCAYSMLVNKIRDKQAAFVTSEENSALSSTSSIVPPPLASIAGQSDQDSAEDEDGEEDSEQVGYGGHKSSREELASRQAKGDAVASGPVAGVGRKRRKRRGARRKRRSSGGMDKGDLVASSTVVVPPHMEPPPEMQIVIDKMASYVAKNGRDFETIVKSKGDPRFSFLEASHQFNVYYRMRLQQYELQNAPQIPVQEEYHATPPKKARNGPDKVVDGGQKYDSPKQSEQTKGGNQDKGSPKSAAKLAPVCFSIKKPKEVEILPLEKRSALLLEESTEEEEGEEEGEGRTEVAGEETDNRVRVKQVPVERVEQYPQYVEPIDESNEVDYSRVTPAVAEVKPVSPEEVAVGVDESPVECVVVKSEVEKVEVDSPVCVVEQNVVSVNDPSTPPSVVDDIEAEKDIFLEFGDSNSPGGLSPTAAASRERHLQQERKRKAAIFLRMIKKEHPPDTSTKPLQSPVVPDAAPKTTPTIETIVVDDDDSYTSIPSSPVMSVPKSAFPAPPLVKKEEWGFSSATMGGHNGVSTHSSRDKSYRKLYSSQSDDHEESSGFHRRHHHHHRSHKHKHRKEIASPISPPAHKRDHSRSRSKSKSRSDRPRNESPSVSKHKKGKKKKGRSRSRSSSRRHTSVQSHHHHHKKSKHHSRHKSRRRDRDDLEFEDEHQSRRGRSRSRERRHTEKAERRKPPEVLVDESQSSRSERRRKESSSRSSGERSSGSESSDSRDSGR